MRRRTAAGSVSTRHDRTSVRSEWPSYPSGRTFRRGTLSRDAGIIPPPAAGLFGSPGPYVYDAATARRIPAVSARVAALRRPRKTNADRRVPRILAARADAADMYPTRPGPRGFVVRASERRGLPPVRERRLVRHVAWRRRLAVVGRVAPVGVDVHRLELVLRRNRRRVYYFGQQLRTEDVIHVRRGADRMYPFAASASSRNTCRPSTVSRWKRSTNAARSRRRRRPVRRGDRADRDPRPGRRRRGERPWLAKFAGPAREPVILPNGTQVIPLAWSPTDTQLAEARRLSLFDVANMFNLDGYWLGAPVAGMTYRTAGPQYQQILRTSLEARARRLRGRLVGRVATARDESRFRRSQLLREDLATSTTAAVAAYGAGIMTSVGGPRRDRPPAEHGRRRSAPAPISRRLTRRRPTTRTRNYPTANREARNESRNRTPDVHDDARNSATYRPSAPAGRTRTSRAAPSRTTRGRTSASSSNSTRAGRSHNRRRPGKAARCRCSCSTKTVRSRSDTRRNGATTTAPSTAYGS